MKSCNLLTLSAAEILSLEQKGRFVLDLSDPLIYNAAVLANESFDECAMQYQILDEANRNRPAEMRIRTIERLLVFLDFDRVPFTDSDLDRPEVKALFKNGFDIWFEDEPNCRHFVSFEKSASMARRSKISFLCDEWAGSGTKDPDDGIHGLKARMDKRLGLEIGITKTVLSKWAAYRGLYFTTARRIESPFLDLNEKSVIVVDDYRKNDRPYIKSHKVVTAVNGSGDGVTWNIQTKEENIDLTPFDGEGLIAPEWAKLINYRYNRKQNRNISEETVELLHGIRTLDIGKKKWKELLERAVRYAETSGGSVYGCLVLIAARYLKKPAAEIEAAFCGSAAKEALYERYDSTYSKAVYRELTELLCGVKGLELGQEIWETLLNEAVHEVEEIGGTVYDRLITAAAKHLDVDSAAVETPILESGAADAIREKAGKLLRMISSFQIRMPFAKGVLHRVDFHSFAGEFLEPSDDGSGLMILDMFERKRSLKDAKIIMTRSMFKCAGWLKDYCDGLKTPDGEPVDPMKYYFEKFHEYHHGLYVANTDALLRNRGVVKINYQFLGPVDLKEEDLQQIVASHIEYADKLKKQNLIGSSSEEETLPECGDDANSGLDLTGADSMTPDDDGLDILRNPASWYEVLREDRRFVNDSMILTKCRENREYLLRDLIYARLIMKGECRFLSCDLLSLLHYLMQLINAAGTERISPQKLRELSAETLHSIRFYLPQATPNMALSEKTSYVFLRNPHLSRNEECVLKPYIPDRLSYYSRYMAHLKGVVMVGRMSLVPSALGGADHDGDLVKIINNPVLSRAVENSVGLYSRREGTTDFARCMPEIMIPSPKADAKEVGDFNAQFQMIKDTFSNAVGHISNLAIQWGRDEYFAHLPYAKNKCVECAILTGLEIDACKNGCHPSLQSVERKDAGKDFYLNCVDSMRGVSTYSLTGASRLRNGERKGDLRLSFHTYGKKEENVIFADPTENGRKASSLDRLLRRYAEYELSEIEKPEPGERAAPIPLFPCMRRESDPDILNFRWRESLESKHLDIVRAMIRAHRRVMETYRVERSNADLRAKVRYRAFIKQILQYQSPDNAVDSKTVEQARDYLARVLPDQASAEEALRRLSSERWMYTPAAKRTERLYRILHGSTAEIGEELREANKAWVAMLSNFSCSGYNLLYYLLKDRLTCVMDNDRVGEDDLTDEALRKTMAEEQPENGGEMPAEQEYLEFCRKYMDIYRKARDSKLGRKDWEAELVRACRADLVEWFSNRNEDRTETEILAEAVPYAYAFRGSSAQWNLDRNGKFFWSVFTSAAILYAADNARFAELAEEAGSGEKRMTELTETAVGNDGGIEDAE